MKTSRAQTNITAGAKQFFPSRDVCYPAVPFSARSEVAPSQINGPDLCPDTTSISGAASKSSPALAPTANRHQGEEFPGTAFNRIFIDSTGEAGVAACRTERF